MFIDAAVFVTTKTNPEFLQYKTDHIEKHLGLPKGFVQVYHNEVDTENYKRGLFNAHKHVYEQFVENDIQHGLILQDDVYFLRSIKEEEYAPFLKENEWDAFYFGHRAEIWEPRFVRKTDQKNIVRVKTNDLHAYLVNNHYAKRMAAMEWKGKTADYTFRENYDKAYAVFPMVALQAGKFGTNSYINGVSERNSQYIRYITKKPFNFFDSLYYSIYLILNEAFFFISSTIIAFTHKHE